MLRLNQSTITELLVGQVASSTHIQRQNTSRFEVAKCLISPLKLSASSEFSDFVGYFICLKLAPNKERPETGSIYMIDEI